MRLRLQAIELAEDPEPEERRQNGKYEPDQEQPAVIEGVREARAKGKHQQAEGYEPGQHGSQRRPSAATAKGGSGVVLGTVGPAAERADPPLDEAVAGHAINDAVPPGGAWFGGSAGSHRLTHRLAGSGSDARRLLLLPAERDDLGGELTLDDGEEVAVAIAEDEVELLDILVRL
jgi:hypothetical protein